MAAAALRIVGVASRANSIRARFESAVIERGDIVLQSPLDSAASLNDHLVWLWGRLKHERRFLKTLQQEGGRLVFQCKAARGPIQLMPNAAEMLHLLQAVLVVEAK